MALSLAHVTAASALTVTIPATTAGNCLVVCVNSQSSEAQSVTGVTLGGSAGNFAQAVSAGGEAGRSLSAIWADPSCAGGQTTVVITGPGLIVNSVCGGVVVYEFAGLAAASVTDRVAGSTGISSSWSSGATAVTAQPDEIWVGTCDTFYSPGPPGAPWVSVVCAGEVAAAGYRIVSGTGTCTWSGTQSGSGAWAAAAVTLKSVATAAQPPAGNAAAAGTGPGVSASTSRQVPAGAGLGAGTGPAAQAAVVVPGAQPGAGNASAAGSAPGLGLSTSQGVPAGPAQGAGAAPAPAAMGGGAPDASMAGGAGSAAGAGITAGAAPGTGPAGGGGAAPGVTSLRTGTVTAGPGLAAGTGPAAGAAAVLPPVYMGVAGGATVRPVPMPGGSQVSVAAPGSAAWTWLGQVAHVQDLKYSFVMPGGADKMTCTVKVPPSWRSTVFSPGWQVRVMRGGHVVWTGRLDEPQPTPGGWVLTAAGDGQRAADFTAIWSGTWPSGQPDDLVNQAIARGLGWVNPGVGQPSWLWTGQAPDPGSSTVAAVLTSLCSKGTGTWYVNSQPGGRAGPDLSLLPVPSVPDRVLAVTTPVPRTMAAMVNRLIVRYQSSADSTDTGAVAAYQVTTVTNTADITAHQAAEAYADISSAGVMTQAAAQAFGTAVLGMYQRVSWAGPFTAAPGQLTTLGGQPVDLGCEQAGRVIRAVLTDYGYGGEVTPAEPVVFPVGAYEYDDQHGAATITPFQSVSTSLSGLVQLLRPA